MDTANGKYCSVCTKVIERSMYTSSDDISDPKLYVMTPHRICIKQHVMNTCQAAQEGMQKCMSSRSWVGVGRSHKREWWRGGRRREEGEGEKREKGVLGGGGVILARGEVAPSAHDLDHHLRQ